MLMISIHFLDVCPINGPDSQTTNTPFSCVAGNGILKVSVLCNYTLGTRGRFFKVKVGVPRHTQWKGRRLPRRKGLARPMHAVRRTGEPGPRFNYELFNCNNFNIRFWSWNYRGCWPLLTDFSSQPAE